MLLVLGLGIPAESPAQDALSSPPGWGVFKEFRPQVGYVYNIEDSDKRTYHFVEIGVMKVKYNKTNHPTSSAIYFSNELGIGSNFMWGPKIGVLASAMLFVIGAEIVYYTDFETGSLRLMPYLGYGNHLFRLAFSPSITLTKGELPLNPFNISMTVSPFKFNGKRME